MESGELTGSGWRHVHELPGGLVPPRTIREAPVIGYQVSEKEEKAWTFRGTLC